MLLPSLGTVLLFASAVYAQCYYPDGSTSGNDVPCSDDNEHSACCGRGYACMSNGLCKYTDAARVDIGDYEYARGSCTDRTFRNSNCPAVCMQEDVDKLDGGALLAKCPDEDKDVYVCVNRLTTNDSCSAANVVYFPGTPSAITTIGVPASTTSSEPESSTEFSTTTSDASTTATKESETTRSDSGNSQQPSGSSETGDGGSSDNKGVIIGGAIGGVAALAILGVGIWLLIRQRRQRRALEAQGVTTHPADKTYSQVQPYPGAHEPWMKAELGPNYHDPSSEPAARHELPAGEQSTRGW